MRDQVFISYSHKDRHWLDQLQVFLRPMERSGIFNRWDDTKLQSGQKWQDEIRKALESAKVAVLLISANFLASDFIAGDELPPLLTAAEADGTLILPVIVSPCAVPGSLSQFQYVNDPNRTLVDMKKGDRDRVWLKVSKAIEAAFAARPAPAAASVTEVLEDSKKEASAAKSSAKPPPNAPTKRSTIRVANGLQLIDSEVGDIAGLKATGGAAIIDSGVDVEVANQAIFSNTKTGDIVGFKQEKLEQDE